MFVFKNRKWICEIDSYVYFSNNKFENWDLRPGTISNREKSRDQNIVLGVILKYLILYRQCNIDNQYFMIEKDLISIM